MRLVCPSSFPLKIFVPGNKSALENVPHPSFLGMVPHIFLSIFPFLLILCVLGTNFLSAQLKMF